MFTWIVLFIHTAKVHGCTHKPDGHAVHIHVAWFLRYSRLESGYVCIKPWAVNMGGGYYM